jgi:hypothetical protein
MADVTRVTVVFSPKYGPNFSTYFHIPGIVLDPSDPAVQAVVTVLNARLAAIALSITLSVFAINDVSATSAVSYVNEDKALVEFLDDAGEPHNFRVPGILESLVSIGKEIIPIDGVTLMEAYRDAVLGNALGPGGSEITSIIGAHRIENRFPLKR